MPRLKSAGRTGMATAVLQLKQLTVIVFSPARKLRTLMQARPYDRLMVAGSPLNLCAVESDLLAGKGWLSAPEHQQAVSSKGYRLGLKGYVRYTSTGMMKALNTNSVAWRDGCECRTDTQRPGLGIPVPRKTRPARLRCSGGRSPPSVSRTLIRTGSD